jgi:hypothetical protein
MRCLHTVTGSSRSTWLPPNRGSLSAEQRQPVPLSFLGKGWVPVLEMDSS